MENHKHDLRLRWCSSIVDCAGCDMKFRLASYDEAIFVQMTDLYLTDGPFLCEDSTVIVPLDFSLWGQHANSS